MKFIYKLEPVKKIKDILEKKVKEELAQIESEIIIHQDLLNSILTRREEFINEERLNISSPDLKYVREYINDLNIQIDSENNKLKDLQMEKDLKMNELIGLSKEKKIHEKLKEAHLGIFKENEKKIESDFLNELAVQGYARKAKF